MPARLERFFDLRPGDLRRGSFLALYYFFIIATNTLGQVVRDALFLGRFEAVQLPYADFVVAAIVGGILAIYFRIGRHTSLSTLLTGTLSFFFLNVVFFWWVARFREAAWLYPVVYIWVGVFGVLAVTQVWVLANYVLTGREARRLFGFVGSGGILGGILGGFLSNVLAKAFGAESLLLAMAAFIGVSIVAVQAIRYQNRDSVQILEGGSAIGEEKSGTLRESFHMVYSSPHLLTIAALISICSIATYIAGWQFRAIVQQFLVDKHAMAIFFGSFYGYTSALAFVTQVLLTPRLLRYFGTRAALMILPIAFIGGTAALIATGALWAATVLKSTDKVVRYSIDTAAQQLLFIPIPPEIKIQAKSFLDTVVVRCGDGLGAVLVLLLTRVMRLNAAQLGWVLLAMLVSWVLIARKAGSQYVATLGETLRQHRLDVERVSAPALDRSATQMLITELRSEDPAKILYVLGLLEAGRWKATFSSIRGLLSHRLPEIRAKAISTLRNMGDVRSAQRIEQLLRDGDLAVRTEALLFLSQHTNVDPIARIQNLGDFEDFSIQAATIAFFARSEHAGNLEAARLILAGMINEEGPGRQRARLESARLMRLLPAGFSSYLHRLFEDDDPEVLREAARATGVHRDRQFVDPLIKLLGNPETQEAASDALTQFGEKIQDTLRHHLTDPEVPLEVKREIPDLLVAISKGDASDTLLANLVQTDSVLRFRIISALNKLHESYPDMELDTQIVEDVLASEIMAHCRAYQIMGKMNGHMEQASFNIPMQKSITNELERIFRLLKMLYPQHDLESAFVGLQSKNKNEHDNAIVFIENTVKPAIHRLVVPLIDGEVPLMEKVEFADAILQSRLDSKDDALALLMNTQDPWLKSCAAHLIGVLGLKQFRSEVDEWANDADPLLREKAQRAQKRLGTLVRESS